MRKFFCSFVLLFLISSVFSQNYIVKEKERKNLGINGVFKERTVYFRNKYLEEANRLWLAEILYDSIPYRPYIRQQLKEKNMPMFLQYLPIVESNYKVTAVSPSGAAGIWQFMPNSMSPYMKKNYWYDERFDPWKETDAALKKLQENYKMFNDWPLALAAYNLGAGAVTRIRKAHPGQDYWALCKNGHIRKETADYVPKLIAIADIVENAELYGAIEIGAADKMIENVPPKTFDYVKIKGSISFIKIEQRSSVNTATLKALNPALIKNCTPPKETWRLRVPKGKGKEVVEAIRSSVN